MSPLTEREEAWNGWDRMVRAHWLTAYVTPHCYIGPLFQFNTIVDREVRAELGRPTFLFVRLTTGVKFSMGSSGLINRKRRPASSLVTRLERLRKILRPTPHVPLAVEGMNLFAKLEYVNPVGSIKDRPAYWILRRAAGRGEIGEETTAVESSSGNFAAADLLPLVYDELRALAAAKMVAEKPGHTLDATALVHEAYLRLTGEQSFESRSHFLRAAAEAMRRILVDHARACAAEKRGGRRDRVPLDEAARWAESPEYLLDLDDALARFAAEEPRKAELVVLRFFGGMSTPEASAALGVSVPPAERWWAFARTWLYAELAGENSENP